MQQSLCGLSIIDFVRDPQLIGGDLSPYQETALRLLYGLPLSDEQVVIAQKALDTLDIAQREFLEATFICGRGSGKTDRIAANVVVYESVCGGHEKEMTRGQNIYVALFAQDRDAAGNAFRYIAAKFENSPLLSQMVAKVKGTRGEIHLTNGIIIKIFTCSLRSARSFRICVAVLDEIGFYRVEGVDVDEEVQRSVRGSMVTFKKPKLIKISTPWKKAGVLHEDFASRHSRKDLLVFHAASYDMHPDIPLPDRDLDPDFFDREIEAIFTDTISSFLSREAVEACIDRGVYERPYRSGNRYFAAIDVAAGGGDEFALSIFHQQDDFVIQDLLRAEKTQRPLDWVAQISAILKEEFQIRSAVGDQFTKEWVRSAFLEHGIDYQFSKRTTSDAYLEALPLINQGKLRVIDDRKQTQQFIALERIKSRTGKDTVSHPRGGHDDRCNVACLAALAASKSAYISPETMRNFFEPSLRSQRLNAVIKFGLPAKWGKWSGGVAEPTSRQRCDACGQLVSACDRRHESSRRLKVED